MAFPPCPQEQGFHAVNWMKTSLPEAKNLKSHLGIYAIIEEGQNILLVKKSRGPYRGMWDLPGGRPAHGETIFQTLKREIKEETGIELIEAIPHCNQAFLVEYQEGDAVTSLHHTCLIYKAINFDSSNFQANINEEDVAGCAWIEKSRLRQFSLSHVILGII